MAEWCYTLYRTKECHHLYHLHWFGSNSWWYHNRWIYSWAGSWCFVQCLWNFSWNGTRLLRFCWRKLRKNHRFVSQPIPEPWSYLQWTYTLSLIFFEKKINLSQHKSKWKTTIQSYYKFTGKFKQTNKSDDILWCVM